MVQFGDFSVQLVEANQDKTPFPEHHHDGKTYVEVKSGQEYFIAISKPHAKLFSGTVLLRMYVDGNYLGFNLTFHAPVKYSTPKYKGHWKRENGVSTDTAIKYVTLSKDAKSKKPLLGKVKIKVFPTIASSSAAANEVVPKNEAMDRCGTDDVARNGKVRYDKDCLLSTITLYCGTRQELVHLGVISDKDDNSTRNNNNNNTSVDEGTNGAAATTTNSTTTTPKRRSKLSRVSKPSSGGEKGVVKPPTTTEVGDTALDLTEADDSDSDSQGPRGSKKKTNLAVSNDDDDGSIVFVDPDMDVIALDDLSDVFNH